MTTNKKTNVLDDNVLYIIDTTDVEEEAESDSEEEIVR